MNNLKSDFNAIAPNRQMALRLWMYERNITWGAFGKVMGNMTTQGAKQSLSRERMPVRHFDALVEAYPELPRELLPEPRDVLPGPKPKFTHETTV